MQTLLAEGSILHTKVKMANYNYLWDQVRKQNFPTFHMCILFWYFHKILFCRDLGTEYKLLQPLEARWP